jgi:hypothetical protein
MFKLDKLFNHTDIVVKDAEELTDALNDINHVCAALYYQHGMTPMVKQLCHAFYKLRIKILSFAIREFARLKDSSDDTINDPDFVARLGQHEAELEEAISDYDYFKETGKIKE